MRRSGRNARSVAVVLTGLVLSLAPAASGHVERRAGPYAVTVGWGNEPPLSGSENFVDVELAGASGAPVAVRAGALGVEVRFGDAVTTLPLVPSGEPGKLRAAIVPTRPGTYAFRVRGTVAGRTIEAEATCSERTFDCVEDAAAVQFPARDPSTGQLAQRLGRELKRADRARDRADSAHTTALIAIVAALLALAAAAALAVRGRRKTA